MDAAKETLFILSPPESFPPEHQAPAAGLGDHFPATRWSLVRAAGTGDTDGALRAMGELCQAYWYPLYAYVRRRGLTPEDAEDVTQGFFQSVIARESLRSAAPEHGRLRAFLLASIQRHLVDVHRRESAAKRGGGCVVQMDPEVAEALFLAEASPDEAPDVSFDRHWARAVLEAVLAEMAEYYARLGRGELFAVLRVYLEWNAATPPYAETAVRLHSPEPAVRSAVHTMRQRFRQIIQRHISETVSSPAEAQEETEYLIRVLASPSQ
jgi:DNA-directed RNA polymerase specialized sigma24 family protein